ncbi:MAG TPA: uracil phosphoribosyltransferase [Paracoccaceae bacterium]|nr:uracil phosphoribosyltransferase [Paracoccaceae bacterium]
MEGLTVVQHPLIEHKLTLMRDRETSTAGFRRLLREISMLLAYEVLRDLQLEEVEIETPVTRMTARRLAGKKLCFVSVLRAGDGLLQGLLDLVPAARVGHLGLYRDQETLQPVSYYDKLPENMSERLAIVVDPMLATGGSGAAAVTEVKRAGARDIRFLALVAAPEGVEVFRAAHPDVPVFTAALDERLNEKGYIVPGLGDAGDRLFGTK